MSAGLEPTLSSDGSLTNVMRDDEVKDYGYEPKKLLENVPAVGDQIKVKRVLGWYIRQARYQSSGHRLLRLLTKSKGELKAVDLSMEPKALKRAGDERKEFRAIITHD